MINAPERSRSGAFGSQAIREFARHFHSNDTALAKNEPLHGFQTNPPAVQMRKSSVDHIVRVADEKYARDKETCEAMKLCFGKTDAHRSFKQENTTV